MLNVVLAVFIALQAANVHATLSKAKPPVFCAPISPPVRAPSVKAQPLPPEVYEQIVQKKLMVTARLQMLFNDPLNPPDLEYGCIAVVFGPPNTLHAERTLLRVNFAAIRGNGRTPVKPLMYLVVRKDVALALADLPGDESRVAMLSVLPDGAISGRGELSPEAMSLMEAVLKARRFRRSTAVPVPRAGVQDAPALQPGRPPAI